MKISEIRDAYYDNTARVSDLVRQLTLAGIAVIWMFRVGGDDSGGIRYTQPLIWPLVLFVAALSCDLLQYVYYSVTWGVMNTKLWCKYKDNNKEVNVSPNWNLPGLTFFWLKVSLTIIAYVLLVRYILQQL
jgi:hypothetical protein